MRTSPFIALCAAAFAVAFGYTSVMPLLPQLLLPLLPQGSLLDLAWHTGGYAAVYMVAVVVFSPVWGAAADRYDSKTIIVISLVGSSLAVFISSLADSLLTAYAGRALQGGFASAILPVAMAALARITDTEERARKVAGLGAASLLGFFVAPALSAMSVPVLVTNPAAMALYASWLVTLIALAIVVGMFSAVSEPGGDAAIEVVRPLPRRFLVLNFLAYLGLGAFEVALPLAARGPLALDTAQVSLLFAECSLMMLAAQGALMLAAQYRARFEQVLVVAIAVYGAGLLLMSDATSMSGATAAVGLIAASAGLVLSMVAYLATLEGGTRQGVALGALTASGGLGQALGAAFGGVLYGYAGSSMFIAAAIAVLFGAWLACQQCTPRWLGGTDRCIRF